MTVLAYRDGVLACDSLTSWGTTIMETNNSKIVKAYGHLAGGSGDTNKCQEFLRWVKDGMKGPVPSSKKACLILVTPDRRIMTWDHSTELIEMDVPYWANGSGMDYALGAFHMGATAYEAVEAAIKHNAHCGGDVRWVSL